MKDVKLDNPFVVAGYFGPEYFCDRVKETDRLISSLKNGWNVTLISPRRLGKTGLIKHAFYNIEETSSVKCFYVDILSTKNLSDLVQTLAKAIVGKLDSPLEKAVKKVNEFFGAFRPTMSFDSQTGLPTFSFNLSPQQAQESLSSIFKYLKDSGKQCCVAIDEFQQITEYPESGVEAMIRSEVQFMPNVRFIFAGSSLHMMQEMFLSASHPFYMSTQVFELHELDEGIYLTFANGFLSEQERALTADDFHQLYKSMDGQTFFVQAVLNKVYSHPSQKITGDFIKQCTWEAINERIHSYQYVYNSLTENQAALLRSIAVEHEVKEPLGNDFSQRHLLPSKSSIKLALDFLTRRQLIYKDPSRGYKVYDRFMGMWLTTL